MNPVFQNVRVVALAASLSCASVLLLAWPSVTQAEGTEAQAAKQEDIGADVTELGENLEAKSRLVPDAKNKSKWFIEVTVDNSKGDGPRKVELEGELQSMSNMDMMSRVGPIPSVVWEYRDNLEIPAHETVSKRYPVPARFAPQIQLSLRPPKLDAEGNEVMEPRKIFQTRVRSAEKAKEGTKEDV